MLLFRLLRIPVKFPDKIAILIDTKGPEIRTTICDTPIELKKGETVSIIGNPLKKSSKEAIYVTYTAFATDIPVGSAVLIDDGELELKVEREKWKCTGMPR